MQKRAILEKVLLIRAVFAFVCVRVDVSVKVEPKWNQCQEFVKKMEPACLRYFFRALYPSNRFLDIDWVMSYDCGKFQVDVISVTPVTSRDR